ncbi:Predicted arabinose efflux permease, MFS family [Asanoa hainanensis]|uniref:Predicted arabinose efflux permease, MFS family n=1 Tax=Asanoa hainanensis TaxID=560556 RepID=A0A239P9Q0_9ACTN|nr:MFS transporter [Asanoa hainanensis]SNT63685.1 Predicted arabinose efflux permease, MFS family [Asanoa hainanensis]
MVDRSPALGAVFWRFWGASALANLGDGIRVAAFPLLAVTLTDSPLGVAAVAAAQVLPWLVTGLLAGALADRHGARPLVVVADVARVAVLLVLVVAVAGGWATITLVVAAAFLLGVGETVRDTAAQTAIPRLVHDSQLEKANGRLVAGEIVGNEFVGPPVGALLFVVGAALPFAANGAALALAVLLVLSLPLSLARAVPLAGARVASPGVLAGLRWLLRNPLMRTLVAVSAAVGAADSAWFAIFVLYARDSLGLGALGFGLLLATGAGGGLLGSFAADRLVARFAHRAVLAWSLAVTAGAPALLVVAPDRWAAAAVVVATSASFAVLNVTALAIRQRTVPSELLGRVVAASRTLTYGCAALGALLGGALAGTLGTQAPFLFSAVVAVLATAAWWSASRPDARPA